MRGVYEAKIKISTVTAGKTLIYLTAPSNKVVEILSAAVTDANNVTNQQLECCLQTIGTLGTPTATTLTPSKKEAGDQAASSTVKGNVTGSEPSYTSDTEQGYEGGPSVGGWYFDPTPEERAYVAGGASIGLRLLTSSLTSIDLIARLTFREIG